MLGESVGILIDPAAFDQVLEDSRRTGTAEAGDLQFIIKPGAMVSGRCGVLITFTAMIDGKPRRVQAVTSGRLINGVASAVRGVDDRTDPTTFN